MKDGVVRVLPPLVKQSSGALPLVLDEAVPVQIAVAVNPAKCGLNTGPEGFHEGPVAGPLVVRAGKKHEQGRGIDTAVVAAKGHFLERGHLAVAGFVEDFPGFGVLFRDNLRGLRGSQVSQHAPSQSGAQPQAFQRGDDPVAAEGGVEPRHAGVRIGAGGQFGGHHVQVGCGTIDPGVDQTVRRADVAGPGAVPFQIGLGLGAGLVETTDAGDAAAVGRSPASGTGDRPTKMAASCCGRSERSKRAVEAVSKAGRGSNWISVRRTTLSNPR